MPSRSIKALSTSLLTSSFFATRLTEPHSFSAKRTSQVPVERFERVTNACTDLPSGKAFKRDDLSIGLRLPETELEQVVLEVTEAQVGWPQFWVTLCTSWLAVAGLVFRSAVMRGSSTFASGGVGLCRGWPSPLR